MATADLGVEHRTPLPGFGGRAELIADLTRALEPGSAQSVLGVFDLSGMSGYRRIHGERATDALTRRLATAFARVIHRRGGCYWPRRDEFCAIVAGNMEHAGMGDLLLETARALWDVDESPGILCWYGACVLPDEAADPV